MHSDRQKRNGLRCRKRRIACHRWVCWWAWSPILELQTREQLSQGQALRLLWGWTPFQTALLCSRASTLESSYWVTASWHGVLQAERSWVSSHRTDGSMPHCFKLTFRVSLYRKTGPHCGRFPTASCPRSDRQADRQTTLAVTVCNCWRPSLRHCWCSVVEQFASRHCCVWHTFTVLPRT